MKINSILRTTGIYIILTATLTGNAAWSLAGPPPPPPVKGKIVGYKFHDLNGNGVDDQEPRLSGWSIHLVSEGPISVDLETVTNSEGEFSFINLPIQAYQLCEVIPEVTPPWTPTRPACVSFTLTQKVRVFEVLFGNKRNDKDYGCTRTQGYWGSSPAGSLRLIELVPTTLTLGTIAYTASQLDQILDAPSAGNALLILAHQLIAAKLNLLNGANGSAISPSISLADQEIGALAIPPIGTTIISPSTSQGQTMTTLATQLDLYNNGDLGVPHCD